MKRLALEEYKHYVSVNPELAAILRKEENSIVLISDMEYGGDAERLRIEHMFFELDMSMPFSESIVACRDRYAGGITFPIENCDSFDAAFSFFVDQSDSMEYWLIDNTLWKEIATLEFDEIFVVAQ